MGLLVRMLCQCCAGKSKKAISWSRSFCRQMAAFGYFGSYILINRSKAFSASAFISACQMSCGDCLAFSPVRSGYARLHCPSRTAASRPTHARPAPGPGPAWVPMLAPEDMTTLTKKRKNSTESGVVQCAVKNNE